MATVTITPGLIKAGPGVIRYAPLGTAIPTFTAAASKVVGTWTSWVEVGATDGGLTFAESTDAEDIRVAESQYPVRTVTTGKSGTVSFSLAQIDTLNWKLVSNGGTVTTSGTGATKLDKYVPPLVGSEVRVMLAYQSLDDEEVLVWPQVFNSGGFETGRTQVAEKALLPASFSVELPSASVNSGLPYARYTAGSLATGV